MGATEGPSGMTLWGPGTDGADVQTKLAMDREKKTGLKEDGK